MQDADRIRAARTRAGLTQAELARRVGTSQPAINRYERAVTKPAPATLERIMRACQNHRPLPSDALREHRHEVLERLCRAGATKVLVFGSVARGEDDEQSDVDLLVDHLDRECYVWGVPKVEGELRALLGVPVDVVEVGMLRPAVAAEALEEARAL